MRRGYLNLSPISSGLNLILTSARFRLSRAIYQNRRASPGYLLTRYFNPLAVLRSTPKYATPPLIASVEKLMHTREYM